MQLSLYLSRRSAQDRKIIAFLRSFRKDRRTRLFKKWLSEQIEHTGSAIPMEAEPEHDQLQPEFKSAPFALDQLGAVIRALHTTPTKIPTHTSPTSATTPSEPMNGSPSS